ncbi:hypothetical protein M011DRAFT_464329 [Sporormia fimetaria CBS 119925]|uniref:Uncharacterized protein n=1 Tax=Sporormia fimetaria CBS 119925 TaxID=1340428 RepID=A0A6A6VQS7_9PLEO|nr:hypothetical protein M011DRAFT_464329 [Sporormia fimetaria CBS 119925]
MFRSSHSSALTAAATLMCPVHSCRTWKKKPPQDHSSLAPNFNTRNPIPLSIHHKHTPSSTLTLPQALFATGDILSQQAVEKTGLENHNPNRTARMALYGGLIFGPAATKWYNVLNRIQLSSPARSVAARIACDQFIFAPTNMALFLSSMAYFEGSDPKERLKRAWAPGMVNNFLLWPWVQAVNFTYVPLEHRVLVVNVVALGWNCYLSYLNSGGGKSVEAKKE